jgi:hypothetical protein
MQAHRIETVIQPNGKIVLENLPFEEGESVEIVISKAANQKDENLYPLRGTVYKYEEPFEPSAPLEDWEALK